MVSAEPAHRASGVRVLNKPTVTTPERATGVQEVQEVQGVQGVGESIPLSSDVFVGEGHFSVMMQRSKENLDKLTQHWTRVGEGGWGGGACSNSCTVIAAAVNPEQADIDSLTHTHTQTSMLSSTLCFIALCTMYCI